MKTTHKLSLFEILLAVLCGIVLALHRASSAHVLELIIVGFTAMLLIVLFSLGVERFRKKQQLKLAEQNKVGYALIAMAGFLFCISGMLFFLFDGHSGILRTVNCLFAILCGLATLWRLADRDCGERSACCALVPIFFMSFFLLMFYRSNGDNPFLREFGYEVAVLLSALLGLYFTVSGKFEKTHAALQNAVMGFGLAMIVQESVFCLLHYDQVLSILGFSPAALVSLVACAILMAAGILFPPQKLPEANAAEEDE